MVLAVVVVVEGLTEVVGFVEVPEGVSVGREGGVGVGGSGVDMLVSYALAADIKCVGDRLLKSAPARIAK